MTRPAFALIAALIALAVASSASAAVRFGPPHEYPAGQDPNGIVASDFNRDGRRDLATADFNGGTIAILRGAGGGAFDDPQLQTAGVNPIQLASGRLNGDGDLDLAAGVTGHAAVLLGGAGAGFDVAMPFGSYGSAQARGTAIGDFNGDGDSDLAVSEYDDSVQQVLVLEGNGDGTFAPQQAYDISPRLPGPLVAARLDRDKRSDLVVATVGGNNVAVLMAHRKSPGFYPFRYYLDSERVFDVAVGDVNNDGRADIVAAAAPVFSDKPALVRVLLGRPGGAFEKIPGTGLPGGRLPAAVALADLDRDGNLDAAIARENGKLTLLRGRGNGHWRAQKTLATGAHDARDVIAARLNGDRRPDLAVSQGTDNTVAVLLAKR